ncbi:MAG: ester cyclase [Deltaproteobacteria bacterium]|nr:ester cyclase [Deltaproteobacteria bacterium]
MRLLGVLVGSLASSNVACTPAAAAPPSPAMAPRPLVERAVGEVFNAGQYDAVRRYFEPGFAEAEEAFARAIRGAFPDLHVALDRVVSEGDWVAIHWTATGTHQGDFAGVAATGRAARWSGAWFWRVVDGRIVDGKELNVWDRQGLMAQLTRSER